MSSDHSAGYYNSPLRSRIRSISGDSNKSPKPFGGMKTSFNWDNVQYAGYYKEAADSTGYNSAGTSYTRFQQMPDVYGSFPKQKNAIFREIMEKQRRLKALRLPVFGYNIADPISYPTQRTQKPIAIHVSRKLQATKLPHVVESSRGSFSTKRNVVQNLRRPPDIMYVMKGRHLMRSKLPPITRRAEKLPVQEQKPVQPKVSTKVESSVEVESYYQSSEGTMYMIPPSFKSNSTNLKEAAHDGLRSSPVPSVGMEENAEEVEGTFITDLPQSERGKITVQKSNYGTERSEQKHKLTEGSLGSSALAKFRGIVRKSLLKRAPTNIEVRSKFSLFSVVKTIVDKYVRSERLGTVSTPKLSLPNTVVTHKVVDVNKLAARRGSLHKLITIFRKRLLLSKSKELPAYYRQNCFLAFPHRAIQVRSEEQNENEQKALVEGIKRKLRDAVRNYYIDNGASELSLSEENTKPGRRFDTPVMIPKDAIPDQHNIHMLSSTLKYWQKSGRLNCRADLLLSRKTKKPRKLGVVSFTSHADHLLKPN